MALTLTRKHGEAIVLLVDGKRIARIEVSLGHGGKGPQRMQLTVDAPERIRVLREELIARQEA